MPRKYKKRPYRKKKKGNTYRKRQVSLGKSIIPRSQIATLAYCDNDFTLSSTLGIFAMDSYSMNGLYDPDITGTGHQPLGFDQMMNLYDHYQVLGVKFTVTITYANADCIVGLRFSDVEGLAPALQTISTFQENPQNSYKFVTTSSANQRNIVLTRKIGLANFFQVPKTAYTGITKYQGSILANPSEDCAAQVIAWGLNGANADVRYSVRAEYITKFSEARALDAS